MARAKKALTVRDQDIMRLEGLLQELADKEPKDRPKTDTVELVAHHIGVQRKLVQEWVRLARPLADKPGIASRFFDVYDRIADKLSEQLYANVHVMATPGERDCFKAALWLLKRKHPDRFDDSLQAQETDEEDDVFDTANVPQEVFDAIACDEQRREYLSELRTTMHRAMEAYETLIKQVQAELLAAELAERHSDRST